MNPESRYSAKRSCMGPRADRHGTLASIHSQHADAEQEVNGRQHGEDGAPSVAGRPDRRRLICRVARRCGEPAPRDRARPRAATAGGARMRPPTRGRRPPATAPRHKTAERRADHPVSAGDDTGTGREGGIVHKGDRPKLREEARGDAEQPRDHVEGRPVAPASRKRWRRRGRKAPPRASPGAAVWRGRPRDFSCVLLDA